MTKPNFLLITSDQQHWATIGSFNEEISTPNLDRLVKEGTTFNRAYCPNPTCTPSRSSIITGKYPSQHGAWTLGTKLSEDVHMVGEDFQSAGYRTALIGKGHFQPVRSTDEFESLESLPTLHDLEFWKDFDGPFYGFEHVELIRNHAHEHLVGQHYALWHEQNGCENWRDYFAAPTGKLSYDDEYKWNIPEKFHYSTWIAERTNALLQEYKDNHENFFLWASFPDPHPPYLVPEPWDTMYDPDGLSIPGKVEGEHGNNPPHFGLTQEGRPDFSEYEETGHFIHGFHSHKLSEEKIKQNKAVYYGMISLMDKYIGEILDQLDKLELTDDTIVVFTSDHGHLFGQHGMNAKGAFHYEDLLKLPFLVRYPNKVPAGHTSAALQSLVDLAPTFLRFSGIPVPRDMTGVDQSEVWKGQSERARDHIICENHHEPTTIHLKTFVDERYKITVYFNQMYGELFDLQKDPKETNNLWEDPASRDLKEKLLLKYIWAELGKEPLWMPRISHA